MRDKSAFGQQFHEKRLQVYMVSGSAYMLMNSTWPEGSITCSHAHDPKCWTLNIDQGSGFYAYMLMTLKPGPYT